MFLFALISGLGFLFLLVPIAYSVMDNEVSAKLVPWQNQNYHTKPWTFMFITLPQHKIRSMIP